MRTDRARRAALGAALALLAGGAAAQPVAESTRALTLREAVSEAVLRNPNRVRAGHEVTVAGFQRDAAEWGRFPTLSVDATPRLGSSQTSNGAPTTVARLEQPLWAGGRIDAQIDSSRQLVSAAESAEGETRQRLAEQTAAAYLEWQAAAERVDIANKAVELFQGLVRYVRQREGQGFASSADAAIASARHSFALAQLSDLRGALARAHAQLTSLTLVSAAFRGVPVSVPPFARRSVEDTEQAYLENSPLVAQRRAEAESARAQALVRQGLMLPKLALRLEYLSGQSAAFGASSESRALVVLQFAPEPGLASYSGFQAAQSRVDAVLAQLQADENDVRLRARTNWADYASSRLQADELEPQARGLDIASASYMRQFEAGRKSWLEVLNTHRETVDAKLALSRARATRDQSALRLMVNAGTFWAWLNALPQ